MNSWTTYAQAAAAALTFLTAALNLGMAIASRRRESRTTAPEASLLRGKPGDDPDDGRPGPG